MASSSRVAVANWHEGCPDLIFHLQTVGVADILAVEPSPTTIGALRARFAEKPLSSGDAASNSSSSTLGNEACLRTWEGEVTELPAYLGPFDAAFLNAGGSTTHDLRTLLLHLSFLLAPGGQLAVSFDAGGGAGQHGRCVCVIFAWDIVDQVMACTAAWVTCMPSNERLHCCRPLYMGII
jgi:hypothetical protein